MPLLFPKLHQELVQLLVQMVLWSVPITVDDVTDVVIGQYAVITGMLQVPGDYYLLEGIWEITAVDDVNNVIT